MALIAEFHSELTGKGAMAEFEEEEVVAVMEFLDKYVKKIKHPRVRKFFEDAWYAADQEDLSYDILGLRV